MIKLSPKFELVFKRESAGVSWFIVSKKDRKEVGVGFVPRLAGVVEAGKAARSAALRAAEEMGIASDES